VELLSFATLQDSAGIPIAIKKLPRELQWKGRILRN